MLRLEWLLGHTTVCAHLDLPHDPVVAGLHGGEQHRVALSDRPATPAAAGSALQHHHVSVHLQRAAHLSAAPGDSIEALHGLAKELQRLQNQPGVGSARCGCWRGAGGGCWRATAFGPYQQPCDLEDVALAGHSPGSSPKGRRISEHSLR